MLAQLPHLAVLLLTDNPSPHSQLDLTMLGTTGSSGFFRLTNSWTKGEHWL